MSLISVKNLSVGYEKKVLIHDISFKIEPQDYICILGENGSGKTSLLRTLLGLQPALEGEVVLGPDMKKSDIGYLPQQTDVQKGFPASVSEIVMSGFVSANGSRPFYTKAQKKQAAALMEKLGIADIAKACFRELSGGQRQRVLLARALCAGQKILFLDEPVTGLDPNAVADLYSILYTLNRDDGIAIVMITHDPENAEKYATRLFTVDNGLLLMKGGNTNV